MHILQSVEATTRSGKCVINFVFYQTPDLPFKVPIMSGIETADHLTTTFAELRIGAEARVIADQLRAAAAYIDEVIGNTDG